MKYTRSTSRKSPKERLFFSIFTIVIFISVIVLELHYYGDKMKAAKTCTSDSLGTVVNVEKFYGHGRSATDSYVATVVPSDKALFGDAVLTTPKVSYKYRKGQAVHIYYDPANVKNYYIQYADPRSYFKMFMVIAGAVFLFYGVRACKAIKELKYGAA